MVNARQQYAKSRLKDNSQMLKNQMYKYNDRIIKDFMQVSTMPKTFEIVCIS